MRSSLFFAGLIMTIMVSSCAYHGDFSKRKYLNLKSKSQVEITVEENINFVQELNLHDSVEVATDQRQHSVDAPVEQEFEETTTANFEAKVIHPNEKFVEKHSASKCTQKAENSNLPVLTKNATNHYKTKTDQSNSGVWKIIGGILLALIIAAAASVVVLIILAGIFLIWLLFCSW